MVKEAVTNLPASDHALVTVWVSTTKGVNLAYVQRVGEHAEIVSYVGKSWGKPIEAGISGQIHW